MCKSLCQFTTLPCSSIRNNCRNGLWWCLVYRKDYYAVNAPVPYVLSSNLVETNFILQLSDVYKLWYWCRVYWLHLTPKFLALCQLDTVIWLRSVFWVQSQFETLLESVVYNNLKPINVLWVNFINRNCLEVRNL